MSENYKKKSKVVVAKFPSHGLTCICLAIFHMGIKNALVGVFWSSNSVAKNIPIAFFSLEMSSIQLITRLISSETGLSSEKLRTGNLEKFEWEQLNVKVSALENAPLYIDDTPSLSIFDLRAKARRLASQN